MSKKNRTKKAKLTISAEAWSWLAQNVGEDWPRVLDLRAISLEAVYSFVKARTSVETYKQFEELSLPPEVLAERRRAEAARIKAEQEEKRRIYNESPQSKDQLISDIIRQRPRFRPLGWAEAEQAAKEAAEKAAGEELFEIPEAIFDPLP
jgi:hypothetical protein